MKKFFSIIPLQVPGRLDQYQYQAVGNQKLQMDRETSFPILTAVHGYVNPGETIEMVTLVADNENGRYNLGIFKQQLKEVCDEIGCEVQVQQISVPEDEAVATHVGTFQNLIDAVEDDDELFACITFGTKPQSTALQMALQYGYRIKENVSVSCVVYGNIQRPTAQKETWKAYVYDETALIQLDEIVRVLADRRVSRPREILDRILSL